MFKTTAVALAFSLVLVAAPAQAKVEESVSDTIELCTSMASLGETIMSSRQVGMPMDRLMGHSYNDDGTPNGISLALIELAYGQPRYSSEEYQRKAAQDFRNDVFQTCYKGRRAAAEG